MELKLNRNKTIRSANKFSDDGLRIQDVQIVKQHKLFMDNKEILLFQKMINLYDGHVEAGDVDMQNFINSIKKNLDTYEVQQY